MEKKTKNILIGGGIIGVALLFLSSSNETEQQSFKDLIKTPLSNFNQTTTETTTTPSTYTPSTDMTDYSSFFFEPSVTPTATKEYPTFRGSQSSGGGFYDSSGKLVGVQDSPLTPNPQTRLPTSAEKLTNTPAGTWSKLPTSSTKKESTLKKAISTPGILSVVKKRWF